jgi:CRISPR-associated exonuclease Cas4
MYHLTMKFSEDDLIPMSALSHIDYCERRYALIHLEQIWAENRWTAEGEALHERVHREGHESRRTFREEYGMPVRSLEWGLTGKCDLVEIWLGEDGRPERVNPVEFKRGRAKETDVDRVQLCAQALCLGELFGVPVANGQLYYFQDHRRKDVAIDDVLREKTAELIQKIRTIQDSNETPKAIYQKRKCDNCSLVELCMPKSVGDGAKSVRRYIAAQIAPGKEDVR